MIISSTHPHIYSRDNVQVKLKIISLSVGGGIDAPTAAYS